MSEHAPYPDFNSSTPESPAGRLYFRKLWRQSVLGPILGAADQAEGQQDGVIITQDVKAEV